LYAFKLSLAVIITLLFFLLILIILFLHLYQYKLCMFYFISSEEIPFLIDIFNFKNIYKNSIDESLP